MQKYVISDGSELGGIAINQWFRTCKKTQQPHVVILKQGKGYRLEWDAITLNRENDAKQAAHQQAICDFQHALAKAYLPAGKHRYTAGGGVAFFYNLALPVAERMATALYDYLTHILESA